ncbi:uncharacterized protein LOC122491006 [Prionailurus bengalensis]|uniref:uncharacterized protein LOC122491006 n=1 Tax=Prionailurus bengalensis TaxID=37029 RepID=UPI001CA833AE|nr:uncharacterized protein LOC122491006 [Prionailurus bengalensis]
MCPATVDLAGDLTQSTAIWFPLQTQLPQAWVLTDSRDLGRERAERERIQSQPSFGLCLWQMHSWLGSEQLPAEQGRAAQRPYGASGGSPAAPLALPAAGGAQCGQAAAAPSSARRTSPAPRAPHSNFCPASPTSAPGSDLQSRSGAPRAAPVAAGAAPLRPAEMTWRQWLSGASAPGWPPAGRQAAPYSSGRACQMFVKSPNCVCSRSHTLALETGPCRPRMVCGL